MKNYVLFIIGAILLVAAAMSVFSQQSNPEFSTDLVQTVKLDKDAYGIGAPVDIVFTITNQTQNTITYTFPTSKRFDFTVDQGGEDIYTFSKGRVYAQVVGTLVLQPGETKTFTAKWNQVDNRGKQVGPGAYNISIWLTPGNIKMPPANTKVRIGAASLANVRVTVAQAVSHFSELSSKTVIIDAVYRGFQPDADDPNTKAGPPVTRSDWAICDSTGCMYVNGSSENLNPTQDIGKSLTVTGKLKKDDKGQVYMQLREFTVNKQ